MALINCPECGRENISDKAEICPSCGYAVKRHFQKQRFQEERKQAMRAMPSASQIVGSLLISLLLFGAVFGVLYGLFSHAICYGSDEYCYINTSSSSKYYHQIDCPRLWDYDLKTTVYKAEARGYITCPSCEFDDLSYGIEYTGSKYDNDVYCVISLISSAAFFLGINLFFIMRNRRRQKLLVSINSTANATEVEGHSKVKVNFVFALQLLGIWLGIFLAYATISFLIAVSIGYKPGWLFELALVGLQVWLTKRVSKSRKEKLKASVEGNAKTEIKKDAGKQNDAPKTFKQNNTSKSDSVPDDFHEACRIMDIEENSRSISDLLAISTVMPVMSIERNHARSPFLTAYKISKLDSLLFASFIGRAVCLCCEKFTEEQVSKLSDEYFSKIKTFATSRFVASTTYDERFNNRLSYYESIYMSDGNTETKIENLLEEFKCVIETDYINEGAYSPFNKSSPLPVLDVLDDFQCKAEVTAYYKLIMTAFESVLDMMK